MDGSTTIVQRTGKATTGILIGMAIAAGAVVFAFSVLTGYAVGRSLTSEAGHAGEVRQG